MFDMSWGEIMVIGGVALIVIGPKDLPKALRTVGQMTAKVRRMAGEFQSQFSEAMREAELEDVKREVDGLNRQVSTATSAAFNPIQTIRDEIKASVDAKSPPAASTTTPSDADLWGTNPVPVVEEVGPVPQIEPVPPAEPGPSPVAPASLPDGVPLVPSPKPETPSPEPAPMLPTPPGLEPSADAARQRSPQP